MNYPENEQRDEQGSAQQNQNQPGQPLGNESEGTLDQDGGQEEDWTEEEQAIDDENVENGVAERYDKDDIGDSQQEDGVEEEDDLDEEDLTEEEDSDETDEEQRDNTII